jgi:heme-degrading monooxygenase HmoA
MFGDVATPRRHDASQEVHVVTMTTRFSLPASTDWKALRATISERARLYEGMAGLRSKAFVIDEASREYGGNYLWESREAAEAFVASETFRGAAAKFGKPDVRIHEVVAYVEGAAAASSRAGRAPGA